MPLCDTRFVLKRYYQPAPWEPEAGAIILEGMALFKAPQRIINWAGEDRLCDVPGNVTLRVVLREEQAGALKSSYTAMEEAAMTRWLPEAWAVLPEEEITEAFIGLVRHIAIDPMGELGGQVGLGWELQAETNWGRDFSLMLPYRRGVEHRKVMPEAHDIAAYYFLGAPAVTHST